MILSLGEDVTEIRKLERQRWMMLEALPNPAWLISRDLRVVAQNRAAQELFGAKEGQYCWKGIWKMRFISELQRRHYLGRGTPLPGTMCSFCEALRNGEKVSREVKVGESFWEVWWVPVSKGLFLYYVDDITKYKNMEKKLFWLSVTDPLTGLYNRRYFYRKLEEEIERARRYGRHFSLVMFDIDHFKAINDRYGHDAGDRVLKSWPGW